MSYMREETATTIIVAATTLVVGLLLGAEVARGLVPATPTSPSLVDVDTLNELATCLEDEASEQCHVEANAYGYEVLAKPKGE